MKKNKTIPLPNHGATDDSAMEKVIAAQARANTLQREVNALRRDREGLLSEFTDLQRARPVVASPAGASKPAK